MTEYIERDAVLALIEERQKAICPLGRFSRNAVYGTDRDIFDAWQEIADQIEAAPTITPESLVVHGRWVKIYEDGEPVAEQHQVGVFCSRCMKMPKDKFTQSDYCPNCGVKMDLEGA